jgi:hypothetical protein
MKILTISCKFPPAPRFRVRFQRPKEYRLGRRDRSRGLPCSSANGQYLNGWYSIPNT